MLCGGDFLERVIVPSAWAETVSRRTRRMADDCEKPKSAKGGGHACAAFNCTNSQYKHDCRGKSFYRFPRDTERCDAWLQNLKRSDLLSKETGRTYAELNKNYRLCGDHFEDSQFTTEEKKRLVWNAVPTLFSPVPKRPRPAIFKLPLTEERSEPTTKKFKLVAKRKHSALPHPSTPATTVNSKRTVATFSSVDGPASSANSAEKTQPPSQRGPLTLLTIKSEPEDEEHPAQDTTELEVKFEPGEDSATGSSCDGERPPMPLVKIEADWEDEVAPPSVPCGTALLVPQVKVEAEEEEEVTDASSAEEQAPVNEDDGDIYTGTSGSVMNNSPPLSDAAMSKELICHEEEGETTEECNDLDETGANSNSTSTQETRDVSTVNQHNSKAKVSRRAKGSQQGNEQLWEEYLKTVNRKHVAETVLLENQKKKVLLDIALLKHELKGKNFTDSEIDAILSGKD